jgi:glyoxylase-like metal-dependent hydrolase (beta-lactamase superfamily II)
MFSMQKITCMMGLAMFAISASLALVPIRPALASAPMARKAAPGYYRIMLGDFEVTALSDGTVKLPVDKLLKGIKPAAVDRLRAAHFESSPLETSVNAYLVNTGTRLVLIDTGGGNLLGPTVGKVLENLKASGYRPDQVDEVLITHMHSDHEGGLVSKGHMTFPNATVWVNKKDADHWLDANRMANAAKDRKGAFKNAIASFKPYIAAGHFKTFTGDQPLVPGIRALPEPGHTPGHTGYLVTSKGHTLLVWGDIIHVQAVQFDHPSVTIGFDSVPAQARSTRMNVLAKAASGRYLIAGAHIAFPGLGHVRKVAQGYTWIPVNYSVPR